MRDFMTACDYCLSDCSDGSRSLGDEDCGPSRECFHVDLGGPGEGNHLGMPENGDPPRPVPRVNIVGNMLRRRRSCRKEQLWLKLPVRDDEGIIHEASGL
jgi:hypothetical protein